MHPSLSGEGPDRELHKTTVTVSNMLALGKGAARKEPEEQRRASNDSTDLPLDSVEEALTWLLYSLMAVLAAPGVFGFLKRMGWGRNSRVTNLEEKNSKLEERVSTLENEQRQQELDIAELQRVVYPIALGTLLDAFTLWVFDASSAYNKSDDERLRVRDSGWNTLASEYVPSRRRDDFNSYVSRLTRPHHDDELVWLTGLANERGHATHSKGRFLDLLIFCKEQAQANRQNADTAAATLMTLRNRAAHHASAEMVEKSVASFERDVQWKSKLVDMHGIANPAPAEVVQE